MTTGTQPDDAPDEQPMRLRRAPKLAPFVVVGAGVGVIVTLIVTSLFPADPGVGFSTLAGYFSLYGVSAGITTGLIWWLVLDRRSKKKQREIRAARED